MSDVLNSDRASPNEISKNAVGNLSVSLASSSLQLARAYQKTRRLTSCLNYKSTGLSEFARSLHNVLVKFNGAAGGRFAELQTGPSTDEGDSVSYAAVITIPGATDTAIEREKSGAAQVSAELYRGESAQEANEIYSRYRDALLMMCPPIGTHLQEEASHELPDMSLGFSDSMEVNMYIYKGKSTGKYSVNFNLNSVKW